MKEIVNTACKRCGKSPRADYDGYCMDCADELGLTEFAFLEKSFNSGKMSKKEYKKRLNDLMEREPIGVFKLEDEENQE